MTDRTWTLEEARGHCSRLAESHYENFPVGSRWIAAELRPHMHAIYAFARTADDYADEAQHEGERLERLAQWRSLLHRSVREPVNHPVFVALADTIRRYEIPMDWLDHLITAFEWDVRRNRHENFASIVEYAKYSANPVGRLVLWLHGYRDNERLELSDAICTALQFANFWQDVAVDLQKDRVYLPQDDMAAFGYSEQDLFNHALDHRFRRLLALEISRTRELFEKGRKLCDRVGRDLRIELRLVWLGGSRILNLIEARHYDVFARRPSLRWNDKAWMICRAAIWRKAA